MESFKEWVGIIANIATIFGVIAIVYAFFAFKTGRQQFHFSVLDRCIGVFQDNFIHLDKQTEGAIISKYIDFVNEQLFYFEKGYAPPEVIDEWIDGMIDYLPLFNQKNEVINSAYCLPQFLTLRLLKRYPRIGMAFKLKGNYNFDIIYSPFESSESILENRKTERRRLIKEIRRNLNV